MPSLIVSDIHFNDKAIDAHRWKLLPWLQAQYKKYDCCNGVRMKERWKVIKAYSAYEVSDLGNIRRLGSTKLLKSNNAEIWLRRDGVSYFVQVGRLVLEAFEGPPPSPVHKARHLNDERSDSSWSNLAWGTQKENIQDAIRNGKFGPKGRVQSPEERRKHASWTGRKHTEEQKRKISEANLCIVAAERAAGIVRIKPAGLTFAGRKHSEETKAKMRATALRRAGHA